MGVDVNGEMVGEFEGNIVVGLKLGSCVGNNSVGKYVGLHEKEILCIGVM